MRDIPYDLLQLMLSKDSMPLIFIYFGFDTQPVGMWSGVGQLDIDGVTYVGGAQLLNTTPIVESQELQAHGIKLTMSGLSDNIISLWLQSNERYQSRPLKIYLGYRSTENFIAMEDSSGDRIALEVGDLIRLEDQSSIARLVIYDGLMDVANFNADRKTAQISLSVESIMMLLRKSKTRYYTHEDQQREFQGDLGLEFIAPMQDKNLIW